MSSQKQYLKNVEHLLNYELPQCLVILAHVIKLKHDRGGGIWFGLFIYLGSVLDEWLNWGIEENRRPSI